MPDSAPTRSATEMDAAEFYARAEALQPLLRERAAETETNRKVPVETVQAFRDAGLTRMTQPKRYGGNAMGWDALCGVAQRLTKGDGAQGWVMALMGDHAQLLGSFPLEAQEDVWGENPEALMSAAFDPKGIASRVDGGYQFSGRFGFASGIDHVDWLICAGFIEDRGKRDGPHFFMVRRSEANLIDDWNVVGLEGTGSKSFNVEGAFVPNYAVLDGALARLGRSPGAKFNPEAVYRVPRGHLTPALFASMSIGMAQGLLDKWLDYTSTRTSRGISVGDQPSTHMIAGECAADIDSADALNARTVTEAMKVLDAGRELTESELLTAKRNSAWACRTALNAGTRLFNTAGGNAIYKNNPLERIYRNLLASAAHHIVNWEVSAMENGKILINERR